MIQYLILLISNSCNLENSFRKANKINIISSKIKPIILSGEKHIYHLNNISVKNNLFTIIPDFYNNITFDIDINHPAHIVLSKFIKKIYFSSYLLKQYDEKYYYGTVRILIDIDKLDGNSYFEIYCFHHGPMELGRKKVIKVSNK